jgi:hypothetical protein
MAAQHGHTHDRAALSAPYLLAGAVLADSVLFPTLIARELNGHLHPSRSEIRRLIARSADSCNDSN